MTPLPTINRCALVLEPTEVYLAWAKECPEGDPDLTLDDLREEGGSVYLIPEIDAEPETWLKRHFKALFEEELEAWCTDDAFWPEKRTYKVFQSFFEVRFHSMVFDAATGPIEKEY